MLPPSQADCGPVRDIQECQSQRLQVQPIDSVEKAVDHNVFASLSLGLDHDLLHVGSWSLSPNWEAANHNVIASLSVSLTSLFKAIIPALSLSEHERNRIPQTARISLERSCSSLILWSDGYGIAEGRLNDTFNRSRKLRYKTLKNLLHIGRVLVERLVPLVRVSEKLQELCSSVESNIEEAGIMTGGSSRQSDDSSSGDSSSGDSSSDDFSSDAASDFSNDDIHEIAEDLKTDTLVLSSLEPLLKYPIFDTQHKDAANSLTISPFNPGQLRLMADTMPFVRRLKFWPSTLSIDIASNAASGESLELADMSVYDMISCRGSDREHGPLSVEMDATAAENRHNVQGAHDLDSPDPDTETTSSNDEDLRLAAAQGDLETVARTLQAKNSFHDPKAKLQPAPEPAHQTWSSKPVLKAGPYDYKETGASVAKVWSDAN